MESFYIIVPVALGFFALATIIFFWAVNSGQFEDLEGAASRILYDDELVEINQSESNAIDNKN